MQKIIGFNRDVPWPVDFRSKILGYEYIKKGVMCDPGDNIGIYINAYYVKNDIPASCYGNINVALGIS